MRNCLGFFASRGNSVANAAAIGLLALSIVACGGGPGSAEPTALPPEVVPENPIVVFPTLEPFEAGPTLTPTPEQLEIDSSLVNAKDQFVAPVTEGVVNTEGLRFRDAPDTGTGFVMAELNLNSILYIYGRNTDSTWLHVAQEAEGKKGWVFAAYVNFDLVVGQLPVTEQAGEVQPTLTAMSTPDFGASPLVAQFFIEAIAVPLQDIELRETPNGDSVTQVPAGEYVTAMARSEDGQWLAVYTNDLKLEDRRYGWVALSGVKLYDGEELPRTASAAPWLELPK